MRKLMLFAIGFTAAVAAGIYLLSGIWFLLFVLFFLILGLTALLLSGRSSRIAGVILLGCSVGFLWTWGFESLFLSTAKACDDQTIMLSLEAADYGFYPSYGETFDGRVTLDGKKYKVRCYLREKWQIEPGDIVSGEFRLRYTGKGGEEDATYHPGDGIFLLAYEEDSVSVEKCEELPLVTYPSLWRNGLQKKITALFPEDTAGFAKALLLGDTTELTYSQDRSLKVSGIRHIAAVSGLHVSILFSLILLAFGRRRGLHVIIGIPVLFLFAAITGFSPSILRACVMQSLIILALFFNKEYDPPTALAFSALVILAVNPAAITSVGFQLSAGCTVGIVGFGEKIHGYLLSLGKLKQYSKGKTFRAKGIRWVVGSVSVTLSAMAVTTPLCAGYFGMVSTIGILTNLLTLWVISGIFYGIMLACSIGFLWIPLGSWIAGVVSWLIRYVLWIAQLLAGFPLAAIYTDSVYTYLWLVFAYLLLGLLYYSKKKQPGLTAAAIAAGLCVCVALSWLEPRTDDVRVSVIDVGQGQSILLQAQDRYYLADCGSERSHMAADSTINYLMSQGIFRLDGLILTHYDKDHAGGVLELMEFVDVDRLYLPDTYDDNRLREALEHHCPEKITWITEPAVIPLSRGMIQLFPAQVPSDDNESSMCILFQPENCDILITGDRSGKGERELLEATQLPLLELLVIGHHGSASATSRELLSQTQPVQAVISVGENNPYGHPTDAVLSRLEEGGCAVYRTDKQGTVVFRR